jgi:signal transduction histidine kinase/HAMP domain-containing protein
VALPTTNPSPQNASGQTRKVRRVSAKAASRPKIRQDETSPDPSKSSEISNATERMARRAPSSVDALDARVVLETLARLKEGDFTARMPVEWTGVAGKIADGFNEIAAANQLLETELARISDVVGQQGRLSQRMVVGGSAQSWAGSVQAVNFLIESLVRPSSEMQRVIGAVASGDLSKKISADVRGEMLELKNTINAMVDQLNRFVSELTRVVREVGTEGKLGQAAAVTIEVGGVWKDLTDNVNLMAGNLTGQVRNIAEVTTAVARGDLSKKISIDVKGEFLELKSTVNGMVDQLNAFAGEVTRVAREVGVEGKLGGQAKTREVGGVWKDLTDNVNQLAANLTNQVRAITDVATAVTEGDLTRQVSVEASGEVATLRDKLNEMIRNLRETTRQNVEQDWLKTNRERLTRMLQGQRDLETVSGMILSELAPLVSAQHGVFYTVTPIDGSDPVLVLQASYGYEERRNLSSVFRFGEGLVGQCAKERTRILITEVPGDYVRINSGLGASTPLNIVLLPVLFEGSVRAVIELASFSVISPIHQTFLDQLSESIGPILNSVEANALTDELLKQAQAQAMTLGSQQDELRDANADLERQTKRLADQNIETELKKREVEQAKLVIEEKAGQLAVSSKYKSEFIANMSHELRTPLNSLLILAEQLEDNTEQTMTDLQVRYASTIRASGQDLLKLLNSILDLAKVESGTTTIELQELELSQLKADLIRDFEHVSTEEGLTFSVDLMDDCPARIVIDPQRLGQILRNLIVNAFKFTDQGGVRVEIGRAPTGWSDLIETLAAAPSVLAISVVDTGIGIEPAHQERVFEAFVQGDGTTARRFGGTGLGLSISRALIEVLGGELTLVSTPGKGSTFTAYLPMGQASLAVAPPQRREIERAGASENVARAQDAVEVLADELDPETGEQRRPRRSGLDDHPFAGLTVLVVDDDIRNVFALSAMLERGQAVIQAAESGSEALARLEDGPNFDLVLMDIMMPGLDGYATIRAIRKQERFKTLPIVAVTGKVVSGERERCMDAGANDYVPKPVTTTQLLTTIRPWLPATPLVR